MAARDASSSVLTEQDSPSPRSVDEGEEPVDQGSHAIPTDDVIDLAALSRLERLPTEILTAIISYDHLSWNDFDACSRVSRRIRQIALPERGSLPALPIILARTEHDESEIVEVPTSACHYKRSLNDDDLCEEIRRVEIYKVRGPENSIELLEEWDPTFFELRGIASHEKDMYEYLADARADELIAEYGVGGGGGWETVGTHWDYVQSTQFLENILTTYPNLTSLKFDKLRSSTVVGVPVPERLRGTRQTGAIPSRVRSC